MNQDICSCHPQEYPHYMDGTPVHDSDNQYGVAIPIGQPATEQATITTPER